MTMLARGSRNAIGEAKNKATLAFSPLGRSSRKGIQMLAGLDAAMRVAGKLTVSSAHGFAGIVFVDRDHLVDAVGEPACDCVFHDLPTFRGGALHNKIAAFEWVH
jgi:hypothetical protein